MAPTGGQAFLDEHMAYIAANDVDGMVDKQYTDDAVLISPFDVLDTPPPHVVVGNQALKDFFKTYLAWQGSITVESWLNLVTTEDAIWFQAIIRSPNTGRWFIADGWALEGGKIRRHYSYGYKLD